MLADDDVCHAPAGVITGRPAVESFMGPFAKSLTQSTLLASHGDTENALVIYDAGNAAVASAPAAELHTARDGRITEIRIIFDRLPFALARGDVTAPLKSLREHTT